MTIPSLSLALLLASGPVNPALELDSGLVVDKQGQPVTIKPGDCFVPQNRCVEYVQGCERLRAEVEVLKAQPPPPAWVVIVVGVVAFGLGVGAAQLAK